MSKYYDLKDDLKKYPGAWLYIIVGGRGLGKTYSTLRYMVENKEDFVFLKRQIEDVDTICAGYGAVSRGGNNNVSVNLSPFNALNRDFGWDIQAASIRKGIGGFWDLKNGELKGKPLGLIFALNGVTKYKGFELASNNKNQFIIFDEFVPNIYDRVSRKEGLQLLDFYKTVSRDRVQRGLNEVKMVCLSNATMINSPLLDTLEITDEMAKMQIYDMTECYLEDKKILLKKLKASEEYEEAEEKTGIYQAMRGTSWGEMTWGNNFSYNDFSNVEKQNLKKYQPICYFVYKNDTYYLYKKDGYYYMTLSRHNLQRGYDLNRENEQKKAWTDIIYDLRCRTIEEKVRYETYTMYDLVVNYRQIFKL